MGQWHRSAGVLSVLLLEATVGWCTAATFSAATAKQRQQGRRASAAFAPVPHPPSFRRVLIGGGGSASSSSSLRVARPVASTAAGRRATLDNSCSSSSSSSSGSSAGFTRLVGQRRSARMITISPPTATNLGSSDGDVRNKHQSFRRGGGLLLRRAAGALFRRNAHLVAAPADKETLIPRVRRQASPSSWSWSLLGQEGGRGAAARGEGGRGGSPHIRADWRRGGRGSGYDWRTKRPRSSVSTTRELYTVAAMATEGAAKVGEKVVLVDAAEEAETFQESGEVVLKGDGLKKPRVRLRLLVDLKEDVARRAKTYKSDWTDGYNRKSLPAIMFLYFACLLPAVAFGGIAMQVTQGTLGVIEYVLSCGLGGMAYAVLSGQPMTFIGPTGLTLAFMTALYSFTSVAGLPFLPVYSWVGLWTSGMLITLACVGASNLIKYATQFTDDVFNALLSVNFIFEACRSLQRNFSPAVAGYSQAGALMSLNVALATYVGCRKTSAARESRLLTSWIREFVADFGPLMVIIGMSTFCAMPSCKGLLSFLDVPSKFMLCNGRSWLVPMLSVTPKVRMACALPAMLLTSLFFLDQNISARVVNSPRHKMVKGAAYHQDMAVLGLITGALSLIGLPWQCAATVQSLNHVRQMATLETSGVSSTTSKRSEEIASIFETRATGFCVHALVLGSLALLPQLGKIPMAVVSGIFLYLGRKVMSGNGFLIRVKEIPADQALLPTESDIKKVGLKTSVRYTAVQAGMLALLWTLKSFKKTALFFPSVIGLLIVVRLAALPKMFSPKELDQLDAAVG